MKSFFNIRFGKISLSILASLSLFLIAGTVSADPVVPGEVHVINHTGYEAKFLVYGDGCYDFSSREYEETSLLKNELNNNLEDLASSHSQSKQNMIRETTIGYSPCQESHWVKSGGDFTFQKMESGQSKEWVKKLNPSFPFAPEYQIYETQNEKALVQVRFGVWGSYTCRNASGGVYSLAPFLRSRVTEKVQDRCGDPQSSFLETILLGVCDMGEHYLRKQMMDQTDRSREGLTLDPKKSYEIEFLDDYSWVGRTYQCVVRER